jgi:hypothetical protein
MASNAKISFGVPRLYSFPKMVADSVFFEPGWP